MADWVSPNFFNGEIKTGNGGVLRCMARSHVKKFITRSFHAHRTKLCRIWTVGLLHFSTHSSSVCQRDGSTYRYCASSSSKKLASKLLLFIRLRSVLMTHSQLPKRLMTWIKKQMKYFIFCLQADNHVFSVNAMVYHDPHFSPPHCDIYDESRKWIKWKCGYL